MSAIQALRHGETCAAGRYCGRTDVALSARGWQQMRAAVAGRSWERIVSSPATRCLAFARELALAAGRECEIDADLRELDFGRFEGRSAAEILASEPAELAAFWRDPLAHPPPEGEPVPALVARVLRAWERIRAAPARSTLIVTHGGPLRVLCALRDGRPTDQLLQIEVPHAVLIELPAQAPQ